MKSARITRPLPLSLALMLAMFLTACGPSNTVRLLSPAPAVNPVLPAPNAPRVTVVPFTDNRQDSTPACAVPAAPSWPATTWPSG